MLDQIVFEPHGRGIKVSAYTDRYAYDPEDNSLVFISLTGTEQTVKAISSAIIGGRTVSIRREQDAEIPVSIHPASRFRVLSTKLLGGAVHQLVVDTRFFGIKDSESWLIIIPQGDEVSKVVYAQILAHLASPLIPEWSAWMCKQLIDQDLIREMEGTLRVLKIRAEESTVDEIVSQGLLTGHISLEEGGTYVGFH